MSGYYKLSQRDLVACVAGEYAAAGATTIEQGYRQAFTNKLQKLSELDLYQAWLTGACSSGSCDATPLYAAAVAAGMRALSDQDLWVVILNSVCTNGAGVCDPNTVMAHAVQGNKISERGLLETIVALVAPFFSANQLEFSSCVTNKYTKLNKRKILECLAFVTCNGGGQTAGAAVASDWSGRVVSNGGVAPSGTQTTAVATWWDGLIADGIDAGVKAVIIPAMGKLISGTTPVIKVVGCDPWANTNFVDADFSVNGAQGDGLSKFIDTCITPAALCASLGNADFSSFGLSIYENDAAQQNDISMGCRTGSGTNDSVLLQPHYGDGESYWTAPYGGVSQAHAATVQYGLFMGLRTSTSALALRLYNSGGLTTIATQGSSIAAEVPNAVLPMYVWCSNDGGSAGVRAGRRFSFIALHKGWSAAEASLWGARTQTLLSSIGSLVV